jgi:hypothetical protein
MSLSKKEIKKILVNNKQEDVIDKIYKLLSQTVIKVDKDDIHIHHHCSCGYCSRSCHSNCHSHCCEPCSLRYDHECWLTQTGKNIERGDFVRYNKEAIRMSLCDDPKNPIRKVMRVEQRSSSNPLITDTDGHSTDHSWLDKVRLCEKCCTKYHCCKK